MAARPQTGPITTKQIADFLNQNITFMKKREPTEAKVKELVDIADVLGKAPLLGYNFSSQLLLILSLTHATCKLRRAKRAIAIVTSLFGRDTLFEDLIYVGQGVTPHTRHPLSFKGVQQNTPTHPAGKECGGL